MKGTREVVKSERPRWPSPIDEMERWFEEAWSTPSALLRSPFWTGTRMPDKGEITPSVDMYAEGNDLVVKTDLPGLKKDDISIDFADNMLTIAGEKKHEEKVERDNYYRFERSYGRFYRTFDLPEGMDMEKAKAHYENGVLEIRIPKSAEAVKKSKTISIE
jgi:HSP20 family protein